MVRRVGVTGKAYETDGDNLAMQNDYRNVYANIMKDWMGVTDTTRLNTIFPDLMDGNDGCNHLRTAATGKPEHYRYR